MLRQYQRKPWGLAVVAALVFMIFVEVGLALGLIAGPAVEMIQRIDQQNELLMGIVEAEVPGAVICYTAEISSDAGDSLEAVAASVIGVLSIDCINLRLPVTAGVSEAQLHIAVGHVPGTAAIGSLGNAVIAGHRTYQHGSFFNRIGELRPGDIIEFKSVDGTTWRFVVYEITELAADDQSAFIQPDNASIITLYTCTPIGKATFRLVVRAELLK